MNPATITNDFHLSDDPALWQINEKTRDYIAKHGFKQNKDADFSKSKRSYPDGKNRCLTLNMFDYTLANEEKMSRKWLVYSESKKMVFCGVCLAFLDKSELKTKLSSEGFNDWKNAHSKLKEHENSLIHRNCTIVLKNRGNSASQVNKQLIEQLKTEITYWRKVLERVVTSVKTLASRGLALRGHVEKFGHPHNGNYMMLLELIAKYDNFLTTHIERFGDCGKGNTSYLSSTIAEELICLLAKAVKQEILTRVRSSKYFSFSVDSTPDIAHVDQLCMIVRYGEKSGAPKKSFLEFLPNTGHKSEDLFNAVTDYFESNDLDIQNCRGQSYDNAFNMSGAYSGLQSRIK